VGNVGRDYPSKKRETIWVQSEILQSEVAERLFQKYPQQQQNSRTITLESKDNSFDESYCMRN
jgi:hypothetical protein